MKCTNSAVFNGTLLSAFEQSTNTVFETVFEAILKITRPKKTDNIRVICKPCDLPAHNEEGARVCVRGKLISRRESDGEGNAPIVLTLVALNKIGENSHPLGEDSSHVEIEGIIPQQRYYTTVGAEHTPKATAVLAVLRDGIGAEYVPVVFWGEEANWLRDLDAGVRLHLEGYYAQRHYQKFDAEGNPVEKISTEVVCYESEISQRRQNYGRI